MVDPKALAELAQKYAEYKDTITNEEMAKMVLVVPFLRILGYDAFNPREVKLEYTAGFAQKDGKKYPDRMDFAIFDPTGTKPQIVVEAKPLGTDLKANAMQLARYIAQLPDLHVGIMADGCHYLFFGDVEQPNIMDPDPFFCFSLDDPNPDWVRTSSFLTKYHRDKFDPEYVTMDAANAKYRQAMTDRLAQALRDPAGDDDFIKWMAQGVYKGVKTTTVMVRLGAIAKEAIEPALMMAVSDNLLDRFRTRWLEVRGGQQPVLPEPQPAPAPEPAPTKERKTPIVTTDEELDFYARVKEICVAGGFTADDILSKDTTNYFNVSYQRPTNWFVRYFGDSRKKAIVTMVPVEEAQGLCPGFQVEAAPAVFGTSRIYLESITQVAGLGSLILRALQMNAGSGM